jgi:hypothetical protein
MSSDDAFDLASSFAFIDTDNHTASVGPKRAQAKGKKHKDDDGDDEDEAEEGDTEEELELEEDDDDASFHWSQAGDEEGGVGGDGDEWYSHDNGDSATDDPGRGGDTHENSRKHEHSSNKAKVQNGRES